MDPVQLSLTLSVAQVNLILGILGKQPYAEVAEVIHSLKTQGDAAIAGMRRAQHVPANEAQTAE